MSNHSTNSANDQLSAFLDGELDDAQAAAVEAALESDEALRLELDQLRSVQRLLRSHGRARAPEGFAARVIAAAEHEDKVIVGPWWRKPFGVPVEGVLIAAAAALVLIVALPRSLDEGPDAASASSVEQKDGSATAEGTDVAGDETPDDDAVASVDPQEKGLGTKGAAQGSGEATVDANGQVGASKEQAKPSPKPSPKASAKTDALVLTGELGGEGSADLGAGATGSGAAVDLAPEAADGAGTEGEVDDPTLLTAGLAIDLYSEDEDILRQLQVLAARYGGTIRDRKGNAIQVGLLEQDVTEIYVDVPSDRASAFTKALGSLDARISSTGNNALTAGPSIKVPIRIVWVKNAPEQAAPPPNAARKANQVDVEQ